MSSSTRELLNSKKGIREQNSRERETIAKPITVDDDEPPLSDSARRQARLWRHQLRSSFTPRRRSHISVLAAESRAVSTISQGEVQ